MNNIKYAHVTGRQFVNIYSIEFIVSIQLDYTYTKSKIILYIHYVYAYVYTTIFGVPLKAPCAGVILLDTHEYHYYYYLHYQLCTDNRQLTSDTLKLNQQHMSQT